MAPRRTTVVEPQDDQDAPYREAMRADNEATAEKWLEVVEEFGGLSDGSVKGHLYKVERSGKFQWIGEYWPPFDQAEIFREMREKYAGGDFQLRITVQGRRGVQKTVAFSVAPGPTTGQQQQRSEGMGEILPLMLQMMQGSADRQMQMMMTMMQQGQASQQQQTQLMVGMMTAAMGGREKMSDLLLAVNSLKGTDDKGGTLEFLRAAKELFGGSEGGAGFDPEGSLIENGMKLAGPIIGALSRAAEQRQPVHVGAQVVGQPQVITRPAIDAPPHVTPVAVTPVSDTPPVNVPFPILAEIADDVMLHFRKGREPDTSAELVYELLIDRPNLGAEIDELVTAFSLSPDWLSDLAAHGIDLRSNPQWAQQFLQTIAELHTDANLDRDGDDPDGGAGRVGDLTGDADASPAGVNGHDDPGEGGKLN